MTKNRKNGRNSDGTFGAGNPGKPKGARHRATRAIENMLEDEAESLTRKAIEMAMEGDTTALRLCLERVAPPRKEAPVQFELPSMKTAHDAASAASTILKTVSEGDLTPAEGAHVMQLIENYRRTLELSDIEVRITALENRQ